MQHRHHPYEGSSATPQSRLSRSPATPTWGFRDGFAGMLQELPVEVKQQDPLFGAMICKHFGSRWFHGQVVDIETDEGTGEFAYLVEYDDGDAEHLPESGVRAHLWRLRNAPIRRSSASTTPAASPSSGLARHNGQRSDATPLETACALVGALLVITLVCAAAWFLLGGLWSHFAHSSPGHESSSIDGYGEAIAERGHIEPMFSRALDIVPVASASSQVRASEAPKLEPRASGQAYTVAFQESEQKSYLTFPLKHDAAISLGNSIQPVPEQTISSQSHFAHQIPPSSLMQGATVAETALSLELGSADSDTGFSKNFDVAAGLDFCVVFVTLALCMFVGSCIARRREAHEHRQPANSATSEGAPQTMVQASPMPSRTVIPPSPMPDYSPSSRTIREALAQSMASPSNVQPSSKCPRQPIASPTNVATPARSSAVPETPIARRRLASTARASVSPSCFRYSDGLRQLREMGIDDSTDVREALTHCQGSVPDALQELYGH